MASPIKQDLDIPQAAAEKITELTQIRQDVFYLLINIDHNCPQMWNFFASSVPVVWMLNVFQGSEC